MSVDVVIPVYKPGKKLVRILEKLNSQTVKPGKIILINTEEKYFNAFFYGMNVLEQYDNLVIKHISAYEFDHGATRNMGIQMSDADYVVLMTDDAVPINEYMIENLIKPLESGEAASSYGRQCTAKSASIVERFTRKFNYPAKSRIKSQADIKELGIKTYFCSNVCAAYNRRIYNELGGFVKRTIFNEDMIYAAAVIKAGYSICYCADALVCHQHHYSNMQQLRRNFDLGVSQKCHPEVFKDVPSTGEGKKLVVESIKYLKKKGKAILIPGLIITSGFKFIGYELGMHYNMLPSALINKITMNKMYWLKE